MCIRIVNGVPRLHRWFAAVKNSKPVSCLGCLEFPIAIIVHHISIALPKFMGAMQTQDKFLSSKCATGDVQNIDRKQINHACDLGNKIPTIGGSWPPSQEAKQWQQRRSNCEDGKGSCLLSGSSAFWSSPRGIHSHPFVAHHDDCAAGASSIPSSIYVFFWKTNANMCAEYLHSHSPLCEHWSISHFTDSYFVCSGSPKKTYVTDRHSPWRWRSILWWTVLPARRQLAGHSLCRVTNMRHWIWSMDRTMFLNWTIVKLHVW